MIEAEWLSCEDPQRMLEFLRGKASDRKLRLLAVACCRRVWHLLTDARSRQAVVVSEKYADGLATEVERHTARAEARTAWEAVRTERHRERVSEYYNPLGAAADAAYAVTAFVAFPPSDELNLPQSDFFITAAGGAANAVAAHRLRVAEAGELEAPAADIRLLQEEGGDEAMWNDTRAREWSFHATLLRDLFGNPFRPVTIDPHWLATNVTTLAQAIYDERAFDRMPILADALEDAGCTNQDILAHCRGNGEHVRGCWALDLVLGKE